MEFISPINLFVIVITISLSVTVCHSYCSIPLNKDDLPDKQPLYLQRKNNRYEIIHPLGDNIALDSDAEIHLACSGSSNYLIAPNTDVAWDTSTNIIEAKCVSGMNLKLRTYEDRPGRKRPRSNQYETYNIKQLKCRDTITGDVRLAGGKCANNKGDFIDVGFDISGRNIFVNSFRTCFDQETSSVLYAEESLGITTGGQKFNQNQGFRISNILGPVHPEVLYAQEKQEINVKPFFRYFVKSTKFLARGHMAPVRDFPYIPQKRATYYYINVVPQWQSINNGNWKRVENNARLLNSRMPLVIYTGVYTETKPGVVKSYLDPANSKIEIPKWTWKIILSKDDRTRGISFVTLNDPSQTNIRNVDKICDDTGVCRAAGYQDDVQNFERLEKGYTYCCRVEDLKKVVPYVAQDVTVTQLLHNVGRLTTGSVITIG